MILQLGMDPISDATGSHLHLGLSDPAPAVAAAAPASARYVMLGWFAARCRCSPFRYDIQMSQPMWLDMQAATVYLCVHLVGMSSHTLVQTNRSDCDM